MNRTDFVFVWINADEHAAEDLKYALRSIEQHWTGDFRVTIVGEQPPKLANLVHLPHTRVQGQEHAKAVDAVRKLECIINARHIMERFVYTYDDCYLLQPMDELYMSMRRAVREVPADWQPVGLGSKKHTNAKWETIKALREAGFKRIWDYETHTPRMFEKRKLQEVLDLYRPAERHLLVPTLYYNHHYRHQEPQILHPLDTCKVVFEGKHNSVSVPPALGLDPQAGMRHYAQALVGKHFWNHNNRGINHPALQYLRHSLWPEPSVFEAPKPAIIA